jgi:hypothetical protein
VSLGFATQLSKIHQIRCKLVQFVSTRLPIKTHAMNPIIHQKLIDWLTAHSPQCPICQTGQWNLAPDAVQLPYGTSLPATGVVLNAGFTCVSCGFVFLIDPAAIGAKF